ncbi:MULTISPECIES: hypothetical protein [unclassified Lysobacter]|uniref:hypothetical protein n=1 Tax=unclassified Lysobacter TaxID=2635362 RepID=UPI001BE75476|nr:MULTISPECIES: hypothetical protein [unclassified Lysobacter]MBT2747130.1 hypothetical protein [Lysobacter sp. ISL-42]MBT2752936.1 hypothetical protein [Lysobacter sp. ISL-50]MBT2778903.1 hypothetical protein [Lysobacter sp. ISL-54]MBT2784203.1 hypothetical protein [Lysobacter sp. ISL-52]
MSNADRTRWPSEGRIEWARDAALLRDLAISNERIRRELGPPSPDDLQVQAKRRPARARSTSSLDHGLKENDTMRLRDVAAIAVMTTGLSGCEASPPAAQPQPAASASERVEKIGSLGSQYKQGMAYGPFRKLLVADGWKPDANLDECLLLTVGDDYKKTCETPATSGACDTCKEFREIEACTDDGYCYMTFSGHGAKLNIKAYGDILRLSKDGSEPIVQEWKLTAE